jgi:3-hydroxy-9,10-secoandrosta-1,3,5(10)-triene-9,17-dione monooxygenase
VKREEYLDRVRTLVPIVRERAKATEQGRRLGDDSARELGEAGLFRALQPSRWGGSELDPQTFYEGVMELARISHQPPRRSICQAWMG